MCYWYCFGGVAFRIPKAVHSGGWVPCNSSSQVSTWTFCPDEENPFNLVYIEQGNFSQKPQTICISLTQIVSCSHLGTSWSEQNDDILYWLGPVNQTLARGHGCRVSRIVLDVSGAPQVIPPYPHPQTGVSARPRGYTVVVGRWRDNAWVSKASFAWTHPSVGSQTKCQGREWTLFSASS